MASGGAMLAGERPRLQPAVEAAAEPLPTVEDLTADIEGKSAFALCQVVQKAPEAYLLLNKLFESRFGDLVTAGMAEAYRPLVEEFKTLFGAVASNLQRCAAALEAQGQPMVAGLVRSVERAEAKRLTIELERQVLRQRLSRGDEAEQAPRQPVAENVPRSEEERARPREERGSGL